MAGEEYLYIRNDESAESLSDTERQIIGDMVLHQAFNATETMARGGLFERPNNRKMDGLARKLTSQFLKIGDTEFAEYAHKLTFSEKERNELQRMIAVDAFLLTGDQDDFYTHLRNITDENVFFQTLVDGVSIHFSRRPRDLEWDEGDEETVTSIEERVESNSLRTSFYLRLLEINPDAMLPRLRNSIPELDTEGLAFNALTLIRVSNQEVLELYEERMRGIQVSSVDDAINLVIAATHFGIRGEHDTYDIAVENLPDPDDLNQMEGDEKYKRLIGLIECCRLLHQFRGDNKTPLKLLPKYYQKLEGLISSDPETWENQEVIRKEILRQVRNALMTGNFKFAEVLIESIPDGDTLKSNAQRDLAFAYIYFDDPTQALEVTTTISHPLIRQEVLIPLALQGNQSAKKLARECPYQSYSKLNKVKGLLRLYPIDGEDTVEQATSIIDQIEDAKDRREALLEIAIAEEKNLEEKFVIIDTADDHDEKNNLTLILLQRELAGRSLWEAFQLANQMEGNHARAISLLLLAKRLKFEPTELSENDYQKFIRKSWLAAQKDYPILFSETAEPPLESFESEFETRQLVAVLQGVDQSDLLFTLERIALAYPDRFTEIKHELTKKNLYVAPVEALSEHLNLENIIYLGMSSELLIGNSDLTQRLVEKWAINQFQGRNEVMPNRARNVLNIVEYLTPPRTLLPSDEDSQRKMMIAQSKRVSGLVRDVFAEYEYDKIAGSGQSWQLIDIRLENLCDFAQRVSELSKSDPKNYIEMMVRRVSIPNFPFRIINASNTTTRGNLYLGLE